MTVLYQVNEFIQVFYHNIYFDGSEYWRTFFSGLVLHKKLEKDKIIQVIKNEN